MPYKIVEAKEGGFRVCDKSRCFSSKPLPKAQAEKQRVAIALSESHRTGKPPRLFFTK